MGNGMNKIIPGLYVGNIRDAKDSIQLSENKITHILSIHDNAKPILPKIKYMCVEARDKPEQDLSEHFSQCIDFIHKARCKGGIVLVHCLAGVSRSVTITVVYIMTVTNLNWRDALNAVRGARRCANPNFGFQRQILNYQHEKLEQERQRLYNKFAGKKPPCDDYAECKRLLEIHQQWVLHGDQIDKDGKREDGSREDELLYPLPLGAYGKTGRDKKSQNKNTAENSAPAAQGSATSSQGASSSTKSHLESNMDKLQVHTSSSTDNSKQPAVEEMGTADLINEIFATDKIKAIEAILAPDTNLREFMAKSREEQQQATAQVEPHGVGSIDHPVPAPLEQPVGASVDQQVAAVESSDVVGEKAATESTKSATENPPTAQLELDELANATLDEMFNNSSVR